MLKKIINYILGYLKIKIEGYYLEDFLNYCKNNNIKIWNIKKEKNTYMSFYMLVKDFKKIKKIVKKTKCKVHIEKKYGIIFYIKKYEKRKIFFALAIICVVIIGILSRFIWNVEIISNDDIDKNEIMEYMKKEGIYVGAFKKKINNKDIINNIRLERNDISWIAIEIKGTNAIIKIAKTIEKPDIISDNEFCNINSNKIGVITKINVRNGTALVKIGDIVKKDDIIVGGWIEGKYTNVRYVHSDADIEAKVWYEKKSKINCSNLKKRYTGDKTTEISIFFGKKQINLFKSLHKFENYDKIEENKKMKLFSNFYIPIEFKKISYLEYENEENEIDFEEAKEIAIKNLKKDLSDEITQNSNVINIENERINTYEENGEKIVEVVYEAIEKIGIKQKFE